VTPRTPTATDCRVPGRVLARKLPSSALVPAPGVYPYATSGRRVPARGGRPQSFGGRTSLVVTPVRRLGGLECYRTQLRFSPSDGQTATIVVQGSNVLTGEVVAQRPDSRITLRPNQPV